MSEVEEILKPLDHKRVDEANWLIRVMREITGEEPKVWQGQILGFGSYHYKYESGREGDWFLTGFSVRKTTLSIYIISGFEKHQDIMTNLGKYKTGKSCLYIKNLNDIDFERLTNLIRQSVEEVRNQH